MFGQPDPLNYPTTPGPGFALWREAPRTEGVHVRVFGPNGYQLGVVEVVYPFQGLCDVHLMAQDFTIEEYETRLLLPDIVTRHYAELRVTCDTPELEAKYQEFYRDAVRVRVISAAQNDEMFEKMLRRKQLGAANPPELLISAEERHRVEAMNRALHKANCYRRMKGFGHLIPGGLPPVGGR